jgi:hypothetical protein
MQSAADMVSYEKSWKDFLHYLDRAWNKLEKGSMLTADLNGI